MEILYKIDDDLYELFFEFVCVYCCLIIGFGGNLKVDLEKFREV